MAIIVPEINPEPIPDVKEQPVATLESFGGGAGLEQIGAQTEKLASQSGDVAAFEKIRADQTAVQEAGAKLSEAHTRLLYDPDRGVLSSQGTNAIKAHDDAWMEYRKTANDIVGTLHGQVQQGAFNKQALAMGDAFNQVANAHVMQQMEKHDANTFNAYVTGQIETAAPAYGNDHVLKLTYGNIEDAAIHRAKRMGLDSDETEAFMRNIHTKYHETVLSQMVNDPKFVPRAQAYFDANKGQMDVESQDRVGKLLAEGSTRAGAQNAVRDIVAKYPTSEEDALKAADKIGDADTQDMARKMISARFQQDRTARHNDQDETFLRMGQMVDTKKLTDPVEIRNAIPVADWNKMTGTQRTALMKRGEDTVTSPKKWLDFMDKVKDGTVQEMSRAELEQSIAYFDTSDKKRAMDLWSGTRGTKGSQRLMDEQHIQQSIETNLVNEGLLSADPKMRHGSQNAIRYDVMDKVHRDYTATQAALGRNLKPEEVQQIIDRQTIKAIGARPVGWFTSEPMSFESIPDRAKESLMMLGRQYGVPVDRVKMEKLYQAHQQGKSDEEILKMLKS